MAFSTISSEMAEQAVAQISSAGFYQTFGDATVSEALRSPLAVQSTKVRRAIKDAYREAQNTNQTSTTDSYLTSVDDPNNSNTGESTTSSSSSSSADDYEETDIYVIIDGIAVQKTFLTQDLE